VTLASLWLPLIPLAAHAATAATIVAHAATHHPTHLQAADFGVKPGATMKPPTSSRMVRGILSRIAGKDSSKVRGEAHVSDACTHDARWRLAIVWPAAPRTPILSLEPHACVLRRTVAAAVGLWLSGAGHACWVVTTSQCPSREGPSTMGSAARSWAGLGPTSSVYRRDSLTLWSDDRFCRFDAPSFRAQVGMAEILR
jgi:hypothetical protein